MPSWFNTWTSTSTSMSTGFNEHVVVRGLWGRAVRSRWDVGSRHLLRGSRCPAAKACPCERVAPCAGETSLWGLLGVPHIPPGAKWCQMHQPTRLLLDTKVVHASFKWQNTHGRCTVSFLPISNRDSDISQMTFAMAVGVCCSWVFEVLSIGRLDDWMNRQGHSNKLPSSQTNHSMDMRRNHFWFSSQNFTVF